MIAQRDNAADLVNSAPDFIVQPGAGARLNGAASKCAACTAGCAGRTRD